MMYKNMKASMFLAQIPPQKFVLDELDESSVCRKFRRTASDKKYNTKIKT